MPKPGYYAVRKGKQRGLFLSWAECEAQVKGYSQAEFKKFKSKSEAEQYLACAGSGVTVGDDPSIKKVVTMTNDSSTTCEAIPNSPLNGDVKQHMLTPPASSSSIITSASASVSASTVSANASLIAEREYTKTGVCYAVRQGFTTGIFHSWAECERATRGYSGASYGKIQTHAEAQAFLEAGQQSDSAMDQEALLPDPVPTAPLSRDPIVLSAQQHRGIRQILSGQHVFLSGSAGTGKWLAAHVM